MSLTLLRRWESLDDAINSCYPSGHWPITETSGTVIADQGQYGQHGTLTAPVTLNNAIAPDGRPAALFSNGYITIPDHAAFSVDISAGITLGALVKFDSIPTAPRYVITKSSAGEWALIANSSVDGNGQIQASLLVAANTTMSSRFSTNNPLTTSWGLMIGRIQFRGSGSAAIIDLHFNGVAVPMGAYSATGSYVDGTGSVRIGIFGTLATGSAMNGYIRNAFVIPEALSPGSITRINAACKREGWF